MREWLAGYGLEDNEAWFIEWQKTIVPLTQRMNAIAEKITEETLNMVAHGLLISLYVDYDREKPFMEQFQENVSKIEELLNGIEWTVKSITAE